MKKDIITYKEAKGGAAEAYRMLRTNIEHTGVDQKYQVILATSAKPREGKTTTVINLAISFSMIDKKVLLIDCDLRKPRVHRLLEAHYPYGLTEFLLEDIPKEDVIQHVEEMENLDVIVAGKVPPMPAELLNSKKLENFISEMRKNYEYIIIDTPPVLSVADASVLSSYVDGVLLVTAAHETYIDALVTAKKALEKVGAKIIGTVLTKAKVNKRRYYYYDYDYK